MTVRGVTGNTHYLLFSSVDLGEQEVDQEQMILERRQLQIMHSKLEIFADNYCW